MEPMKIIPMNLLSPLAWGSALEDRAVYWALPTWLFKSRLEGLLELSFIHFARWVIVPKGGLPRLSEEQPREHLAYDYLYFASNYNGQWDHYIDAFSDVVAGGLDGMWHGSVNWVPATYVAGLKRWVRWHQIKRGIVPTDHYYCAYPHATTTDIKGALQLCDALVVFQKECAAQSPDETDDAFMARFHSLLIRVQHCLGSSGPPMVDADVVAKQLGGLEEPITPPPFH
jgi:hypothetical protein